MDLFIRPSGEQRTSNFMLWQSAYAEMVFQDILWPDFDRRDLWRACEMYARRDRRFGGAVDAAGLATTNDANDATNATDRTDTADARAGGGHNCPPERTRI